MPNPVWHKTYMYPKKSLGQHYLRCKWVIDVLLAAAAVNKADAILEIGPGTGVLTRALAQRAKKVIAVEKDEALARALRPKAPPNVTIVEGDILRMLQSKIRTSSVNAPKIVSNIPYYLTSRLLRILLETKPRPELIVLTIQKEVAERIIAKPPHMNLLALSVQAFGTARIVKAVPADCFSPKPNVDSAIIRISAISDRFFRENHIDQASFFGLIRLGFSQKRKRLPNTLGGKKGIADKKTITDVFVRLGLSPNARPEELSLQSWADISALLP